MIALLSTALAASPDTLPEWTWAPTPNRQVRTGRILNRIGLGLAGTALGLAATGGAVAIACNGCYVTSYFMAGGALFGIAGTPFAAIGPYVTARGLRAAGYRVRMGAGQASLALLGVGAASTLSAVMVGGDAGLVMGLAVAIPSTAGIWITSAMQAHENGWPADLVVSPTPGGMVLAGRF